MVPAQLPHFPAPLWKGADCRCNRVFEFRAGQCVELVFGGAADVRFAGLCAICMESTNALNSISVTFRVSSACVIAAGILSQVSARIVLARVPIDSVRSMPPVEIGAKSGTAS
jgi:hypothetical protein